MASRPLVWGVAKGDTPRKAGHGKLLVSECTRTRVGASSAISPALAILIQHIAKKRTVCYHASLPAPGAGQKDPQYFTAFEAIEGRRPKTPAGEPTQAFLGGLPGLKRRQCGGNGQVPGHPSKKLAEQIYADSISDSECRH